LRSIKIKDSDRANMAIFIQFLIIVLLLTSCSQDRQPGTETSPPSPAGVLKASNKLTIEPSEATRESTFYISSREVDLSKARVQWFVNGMPIDGAISAKFSSPEIKKGDLVYVRVTIGDKEMESNQVRVKNIPPLIARARIIPAVPKANDALRIDIIGNDRDGDSVSYRYEWFKNGEPMGSGEVLEGPFRRGDKISVKITPYDGEDFGSPLILTAQIFNSPPKPSGGGEEFRENIYSYRISASDPDGDPLTYFLKKAPAGMVIDRSTGLITWRVTEKDAGRHPVTVQVSDGHGGEVLYNFDVTIGFEGK